MSEKAIITCALNGVLTNPDTHPVPVTPEQMAAAAAEAYDAGATVVVDQHPETIGTAFAD